MNNRSKDNRHPHVESDFFDQIQESEPKRFGLLSYFSISVIAVAMGALYLYVVRENHRTFRHNLINIFFVLGVLYTSIGIFSWINHEGFYDGAGYSIRRVLDLTKSAFFQNIQYKYDSLSDYKKVKEKKRTAVKVHFLFVGAAMIALSFFFTVIRF